MPLKGVVYSCAANANGFYKSQLNNIEPAYINYVCPVNVMFGVTSSTIVFPDT